MARLHIAMPHCGHAANSTSGGEVAERELLRHLPADIDAHVLHPRWKGLRWWNSIAYFRRALGDCIEVDHPTLIRAHSLRYTGLAALWAGRRYGLPVSVHFHHLESDGLSWLDHYVLRRADQVTTDSYFSCDQAFQYAPSTTVIRLGVDHARFQRWPMSNERSVLLIGGVKKRKNVQFVRDLWPQVLAKVPSATLHELGEGTRTLDAQVPWCYRGARVVAMPSTLEGFGLPVLEAMATARPIVCSDRGALPAFGTETTPLVPSLWVERLVRLLTDDAQWVKESEQNLALAAAYSWERTASGFASAWRQVAA